MSSSGDLEIFVGLTFQGIPWSDATEFNSQAEAEQYASKLAEFRVTTRIATIEHTSGPPTYAVFEVFPTALSNVTIPQGVDVQVTSGGLVQSLTVSGQPNGTLLGSVVVYGGATATDVHLLGGALSPTSGGTTSHTRVDNNGIEIIDSGGVSFAATINTGYQAVNAGGSALSATINSGGFQIVSGGLASGTQLSGGSQWVEDQGTAADSVVFSGGSQLVFSGGVSTNAAISSGGYQTISSDGSTISTTVFKGGFEYVSSGGTAIKTTVSSGGRQSISAGGSATSTTVLIGGFQEILGSADHTLVSRGSQDVASGGRATDTVVNGGSVSVQSGGVLKDLQLTSGAQLLLNGGEVLGDKVSSSATVLMERGLLDGAIVNNGKIIGDNLFVDLAGSLPPGFPANSAILAGEITGSGTIVVGSGAVLSLDGNLNGYSGEIAISGGTLEVASTATLASSSHINFENGLGALLLDDPYSFLNNIDGLVAEDPTQPSTLGTGSRIELSNIDNVLGTSITTDPSSNDTLLKIYTGDAWPPGTQLSPSFTYKIFVEGSLDVFFKPQLVTNSETGQTDTVLTLTKGSPLALSVNAPAAWKSGFDGASVKVAAISNNKPEADAMVQLVEQIAPSAAGKSFTPDPFDSAQLGLEEKIKEIQDGGYDIIVDDIGLPDDTDLTKVIDYAANGYAISFDSSYHVIRGSQNKKPITFFTAAGNNEITPHALDPNEMAVGAVNWINTPYGGISPFVNESFSSPTADISAPDSGSTSISGFNPFSGTSAAAPIAAGVAALVLSKDHELTPFQVHNILASTALPFGNSSAVSGAGLLQADAAVAAACYCCGTLIATVDGDRRVEELAIGDEILTSRGDVRPIKWIGRRTYSGRFLLGQKDILPICIKMGAIADGVPKRDLWISPHHAMYLENILIEAKDLINGVSISQAEDVESVEYFHIELDSHDVIIAEGALSETFVDDDSRNIFHNAHEYYRLYPRDDIPQAIYCAPRRHDGYEFQAARRKLNERAAICSVNGCFGELRGFVDIISSDQVCGWAQDPRWPEAPVCLDVVVGDEVIGQTIANRYRADLKKAGLGSGHHSFEFVLNKPVDLSECKVEVRRSADRRRLAQSD